MSTSVISFALAASASRSAQENGLALGNDHIRPGLIGLLGGRDGLLGLRRAGLMDAGKTFTGRWIVAGRRFVPRGPGPLAADVKIVGRDAIDHFESNCHWNLLASG
jgi:hypothetical protein